MNFLGQTFFQDRYAVAFIERTAPDPVTSEIEWIIHFAFSKRGVVKQAAYQYYKYEETARRAAQVFLDTGNIEKAKAVKPLEDEMPQF